MRLVVAASVDQRTERGCHLYHRTVKGLSYGTGSQINIRHPVRAVQKSCRLSLSRKVDPRLYSKVKILLIFCKHILSFFKGNIHQRHIA